LGRTAQLKKTSEQRCREAFGEWYLTPGVRLPDRMDDLGDNGRLSWNAWQAAWRHLEARLIEEIQS
jgi:hypothetical protein